MPQKVNALGLANKNGHYLLELAGVIRDLCTRNTGSNREPSVQKTSKTPNQAELEWRGRREFQDSLRTNRSLYVSRCRFEAINLETAKEMLALVC